jgi:hypothetical protein
LVPTNRRKITWSLGASILFFVYLSSMGVLPVAHANSESSPSQFNIIVGPYNVIVLPSLMPFGLFESHPEAEGHPVVESFVSRFNPIWIINSIYFNESVGAPTHVSAGILVALNQSGFWQLVFSTNGTTSSEIQWTCTVSGNRMLVNTSTILLTGIERLLAYLPAEQIQIYCFYLSAVGWGDNANKEYYWHLYFVVETGPWTDFFVTMATNGTVIDEGLLSPPGGNMPPIIPILSITVVGVIILIFAIWSFTKSQSTIWKWHNTQM